MMKKTKARHSLGKEKASKVLPILKVISKFNYFNYRYNLNKQKDFNKVFEIYKIMCN